ncbi:ArfGap protein [Rhizoctonia solani]|uniref:ArfGap protein n=1 Tax=Rhizoctonia solani TaxID=456999 RepID=A0A8H7I8E7_9AGAM|nr:ArfGap protein [Rhizoctonia solani]
MKVGGNQSATDFYNKHGAQVYFPQLTPSPNTKVASRIYTRRSFKNVLEKMRRGIHIEGAPSAPRPPHQPPMLKTTSFRHGTSPLLLPLNLLRPRLLLQHALRELEEQPVRQVPLPPTPTATPPRSHCTSYRHILLAPFVFFRASPKPVSGPKVSKLGVSKLGATKGGLGAKKAGAPIFEAAEKKAREEEERIKQLGYDAEREKTSSADVERLGMGFGRLGFGQVAGGPCSCPAKKYAEVDEVTTARDRFGNQKAISSDMYFGRNDYDPTAQAEASNRLQQFRGATSISSNQYFGREEDASLSSLCAIPSLLIMYAFQDLDNAGLSSTSFNNDSLAGIEAAARDALTRVMANPDVQNAAESIRAGALKLGDYLAQMSEQR